MKLLSISWFPQVNPSHAMEEKSTLCLSYKVPYHLGPDWGKKIKAQLYERLITKTSAFIPDLKKRIVVSVETTSKTIERWTHNRWRVAMNGPRPRANPASTVFNEQRPSRISTSPVTGPLQVEELRESRPPENWQRRLS